jgi:nitroimidazol reductase NimA-like FMN-containing flavoprotein (pyridoxamine 5'-phosphate oxidase superfamily)
MTDHRVIDALARDECLRLLACHSVGRLAFMDHVGIFPMLIPVTYALHGGAVVFRTGHGSQLGVATRGEPVAFEVDRTDQLHQGWSVVVRGFARLVTEPDEMLRLLDAVQPWAPGSKPNCLRIEARQISGRRIALDEVPVPPAA